MGNFDFNLTVGDVQLALNVRYSHGSGTAFVLAIDKGTVFASAAHLFQNAIAGDKLQILRTEGWVPFTIRDIRFDEGGHDICVFSLEEFSVVGEPIIYPQGRLFLGGKVQFVGFPHGLAGDFPGQGFATPLVRTAFFSGNIEINGRPLMVLDGFNNPGYSGSPVFSSDGEGKTALFAMVSSYRYEKKDHSKVYRLNEAGQEEVVQDYYVKPNSGMIYAENSNRIRELAKKLGKYNLKG